MRAQFRVSTIQCLLYASIWLISVIKLPAQSSIRNDLIQPYLSEHLPIDNQNWEISQNPVNGSLYFANSAGLVEYNGITTRLFNMPFKQGVRSVYVNRNGTIFSGSFEDFGYWESDGEGGLHYHSLARNITVEKNDEIWNIHEINGTLFFQSFTTIYAFSDNKVNPIRGPAVMLFAFRTRNELIVQALGKGLFRFNGRQFEFIKGSQLFGFYKVHALIEMPNGHYWICTDKNGIFVFDGTSFEPMNNPVSQFLKVHTCNGGLAINDSLLVFGTILNGLAFCDDKGNILKKYNVANGLNNNTVLSLFLDRDKGLWVGLDEGANYLNINSPIKRYSDTNGTLGTVYTVFRKAKQLYLGTNHGLFVGDISSTRGDYNFTNLTIVPNTQGQVWKIFEYGDQLLCGHNEGTFLVNGREIRKISEVTGGYCFAGYGDVLLQGTYTGIVSFIKDPGGNWKFNERIIDFYEPTRYIEVDYLGYVWAIHPQKGIYRFELNERLDSAMNILHFNAIADTSEKISMAMVNNQLVFMTSENIYTFDYGNRSFSPLKSLATTLGEYMGSTQIVHYEKNSYWFMLEDKMALFDISRSFETRKITELIHKYSSLPGREQQIIAIDRKTMLIPTRQAFSTINLALLEKSEPIRAPVISRLVFSGKDQHTVIIPNNTISCTVPNRQHHLNVYLSDPARFDQDDKIFLYRIPELDEEWHQTVLDNFTYLNLKHGTYHLQVRISTSDEMTETVFTIHRPWYISIFAGVLYLAVLTAITLLGIRIFRFELDRHRRLIEYEVRRNKLESELDHKSYELMLTMRYLIRKTEILKELQEQINALKTDSSRVPVKFIKEMERIIREGLDSQTEEWKNAMNNLKLSQEGFFRKLKEKFPNLTPNDLRLCSYLRMNFTTKEMAHLLNISGRAVEIGRYRLRRKMHLDHGINLTDFLIREAESEL